MPLVTKLKASKKIKNKYFKFTYIFWRIIIFIIQFFSRMKTFRI